MQAMDGSMSLEEALEQRLSVINCTPADIQAFLAAHPPESRLVPGGRELVAQLQRRGVAVYLIRWACCCRFTAGQQLVVACRGRVLAACRAPLLTDRSTALPRNLAAVASASCACRWRACWACRSRTCLPTA